MTDEKAEIVPDIPRLVKWLQIIPWLLIPLILGCVAWITSAIRAADYEREDKYRKEFVLIERYEADKASTDHFRDQIEKKLDSIDKKLDRLAEHAGKK